MAQWQWKKKKNRTKIIGDEELIRKFRELDRAMAGDVLEEAVLEGAELIREDASQRAPRKTGNLARNIIKETMQKDQGKATAGVGPNKDAFYGLFVEMGTSKMDAQPFLFPAYESKKKEVKLAIRDKLREAIDRVVK